MNNPLKIRLLRGICLRAKGNVAYAPGVYPVNPETKNPNEQELLRLAQPGVTHMGRKVAEFVLDGPAFAFNAGQLEMIRMA